MLDAVSGEVAEQRHDHCLVGVYGKETDSWIGLACSQDKPGVNVIPTQLIEAIFLFLLSAVLIYLAFKKRYKYTFVVYSVSYSIYRFVIEFFRDDPRGEFLKNLSPSQIWCAIIFMCTGVIIWALNKFAFNQKLDEQK